MSGFLPSYQFEDSNNWPGGCPRPRRIPPNRRSRSRPASDTLASFLSCSLSSSLFSCPFSFPNPSASPLPPIRPSHGDKYSSRVSGGLRVHPDSSRPLYYPSGGLRCADNVGRSRSLPSNCTSLASPIMAHSMRNHRARMVLTFHTLCHSIPPSKMLPSPQIQLAVTASPTFSCSPCFSSSHGIRPARWVVASTPPSSLPSLPPSPS